MPLPLGNGPRIGKIYQAKLPSDDEKTSEDKSVLLWKSPDDLDEDQLNDFLAEAEIKYGYSLEQALGLLQWNKYNYEKSRKDIRYYQPCHDKWSPSDCTLFEQAFTFNGKCFHRIQQIVQNQNTYNATESVYI